MIPLKELGTKICIIGNSAAGKSTLAQALATKLELPFCHLDQIAHIPFTDWHPREKQLIARDHTLFLTINDSWVIEGNYSFLMEERFCQATAIIWLNFSTSNSLFRYMKRTLFDSSPRIGTLEGSSEKLNPIMVNHILFQSSKNKGKYRTLIEQSQVQLIEISNFAQLKNYYKHWQLQPNNTTSNQQSVG